MLIRTLLPDLYLQSMLPAIDEVVMTKYSRFPDQWSSVFRMENSSRSIEQTTEVTGFGQFSVVPEGEATRYDTPLPAFNKTYTHAQYGLGFKVTKVAMDDDKFGVVRKLATELGRSAKETIEVTAASIINTGFVATTGPDGTSLFSTTHPMVGGGVQSNRLAYATDPDVTSIQLALTQMRQTLDHRGKKLRIPPKTLILPNGLEFVGAELLGGADWRPDTANRTINAFRRRSGMPSFDSWMVWDYLTDMHAWMIEGERTDTELRYYWREQFNTIHDLEFDSRSVKTAGWMRFSAGYNGWYGLFGVPSS
jgi:phage major head subunit gpT-like protein